MNRSEISIRPARLSDLAEIQQLFVDTISSICKNDYTPAQIVVWIASVDDTQRWMNKLASQYFLVATLDSKIVGFASLENGDYLDFLYVHKDFQRRGIAGKLYTEIEKEAINRQATTIHSAVSLTAKPFFEKQGFKTITLQTNLLQGVEIINFKMAKILVL